ncbi:MAG: hypothetical protein ABR860_11620 [Terracidiphilus sp.]|jgi:hypothetical protein
MPTMDIIELFSNDLLELPRSRSEEDYGSFLKNWFDEFLALTDSLTGDDLLSTDFKANRAAVQSLCDGILAAMKAYLNGHPSRAYEHFQSAIRAIQPHLAHLVSQDVSSHLQFLYRIRVGSLTDFTRRDLFHIPFEMRTLVKPQRYSISGLPCLYLGGSIWVCWEELERPSFEKLQISRFKAADDSSIKVLDLGFRPAMIAAFMATHPINYCRELASYNFILAHTICWPLFAACSVRVKHRGNPFVPEYVIPQLLLQWIQSEPDFDGVRYFSTQVAQYVDDPRPAANYVFPVRTSSQTGFCEELSRKFLLSRPMSWQILESFPFTFKEPVTNVPTWPLKVNADVDVSYGQTKFFSCEAKIRSLPCEHVQTI